MVLNAETMDFFTLNDGTRVPALCFGPGMMTRGFHPHAGLVGRVINKLELIKMKKDYLASNESAIKAGARFFDYSAVYGNEDLIAKAIQKSGINRKEFILTTRVPNSAQFSGTVRESVLRSIDRFATDYIDLLMFHWPITEKFCATWEEMIRLREEGICRSIGVANCHSHHLDSLIERTGVMPCINQVEVHPLFSQKSLIEYCKKKGIVIEAYTPLARMDERMTRLPLLKAISKKYNKSLSQVILRWHIQNGVIPVFRSLNSSRQLENFSIFDFELSDEDMKAIDSVNINSRLRYDPDNCDFSIL